MLENGSEKLPVSGISTNQLFIISFCYRLHDVYLSHREQWHVVLVSKATDRLFKPNLSKCNVSLISQFLSWNNFYFFWLYMCIVTKQTCWINLIKTVKSSLSGASTKKKKAFICLVCLCHDQVTVNGVIDKITDKAIKWENNWLNDWLTDQY